MLEQIRAIGDTLSLLAVQLKQDGVAYDLTGKSVEFSMYDALGVQIVAPTTNHVTISNPALGYAEYDFQAADVANAGTYYAYFTVLSGGETDTFVKCGVKIILYDPAAPKPTTSNEIDILALANAPTRTRTAEGTVEERTINEIVKADQYAASKAAAENMPWGIRLGLTRPSGTVGQSHRGVF